MGRRSNCDPQKHFCLSLLTLPIGIVLLGLYLHYSGLNYTVIIDSEAIDADLKSSKYSHVQLWRATIQSNKIFGDRLKHLQSTCRRRNFTKGTWMLPRRDLSYLYVDDMNKIIFCATPKVGSTVWKKIFLVLTQDMDKDVAFKTTFFDIHTGRHGANLRGLDTYNQAEISERLETYFKFFFVRDPFERISSAFKDRFYYQNNPYYAYLERMIMWRYRDRIELNNLIKGRNINFTEYSQFLTDPHLNAYNNGVLGFISGANDGHWGTLDEVCQPCLLNYNFVGFYENLRAESNYLLDLFDPIERVRFPGSNLGFGSGKSDEYSSRVFRDLYINRPEIINQLYQRYYWDFNSYNYSFSKYADR